MGEALQFDGSGGPVWAGVSQESPMNFDEALQFYISSGFSTAGSACTLC